MAEEVSIDVQLAESTDDGSNSGDEVRGRVSVRVADTSGSPLPAATITVSGQQSDYEESKSAKDYGMSQTFENVPFPATVLVEATGYESYSVDITESDLGSTIANY